MPLYSWLLSSLVVSQIGGNPSVPVITAPPTTHPSGPAVPVATYPATPAAGGAIIQTPATAPARFVQPPAASARPTTAQLVADALTLPPAGTISGQPAHLVSVVATVPERQRQIEAVHAYWKLAEAIGEYHFCQERQQRLARLRAGNDEAADLRTAQAVATARMREAEVQVTTAQHDLAEILLLAPGTPLPLPADEPLVGPYRTLFAELFAGKTAPQRARTLDQTLPLRSRAVESHAAALLAAEDSLDAAIELQASGQEHLAGVLSALDAHVRQQRAFLAAVFRYNHDIADYALVVVSLQATPDLLVGTLIKQNRPAGQPVTPLPTMATLPAAYPQTVVPAAPTFPNRPTRAVRPEGAAGQTPKTTIAIGAEETVPIDSPAVPVPPNPPRSHEPEEPRLAPPQESAIPLVPEKPAGSVPLPTGVKSIEGPTTRSSQKPISANGPPQASALETYSGLLGLTPAERTGKLVAALYGDRDLPRSAGQTAPFSAGETPTLQSRAGVTPSLRLIDCLRTAPTNSRSHVVEAYWAARQIGAQFQNLVEQVHWLEALGPAVSAQNPPSPVAMLRLRTARLSVEAERADAEADWRLAQLDLAGVAGLGAEKTLLQPTSVPFVGRLPLPASPTDGSWSRRRLEATIPRREQVIIDQAVVVVEADALRAAATADFLAGRSSVERVIAGIDGQARETSAFLRGVTEYNRAIAQYAIATLPTNIAVEKLVAALMVE